MLIINQPQQEEEQEEERTNDQIRVAQYQHHTHTHTHNSCLIDTTPKKRSSSDIIIISTVISSLLINMQHHHHHLLQQQQQQQQLQEQQSFYGHGHAMKGGHIHHHHHHYQQQQHSQQQFQYQNQMHSGQLIHQEIRSRDVPTIIIHNIHRSTGQTPQQDHLLGITGITTGSDTSSHFQSQSTLVPLNQTSHATTSLQAIQSQQMQRQSTEQHASDPKTFVTIKRSKSSSGKEKHCENCGTSDTPAFRRGGPTGRQLLCNRCCLYYARTKTHRPATMPNTPPKKRRRKRKDFDIKFKEYFFPPKSTPASIDTMNNDNNSGDNGSSGGGGSSGSGSVSASPIAKSINGLQLNSPMFIHHHQHHPHQHHSNSNGNNHLSRRVHTPIPSSRSSSFSTPQMVASSLPSSLSSSRAPSPTFHHFNTVNMTQQGNMTRPQHEQMQHSQVRTPKLPPVHQLLALPVDETRRLPELNLPCPDGVNERQISSQYLTAHHPPLTTTHHSLSAPSSVSVTPLHSPRNTSIFTKDVFYSGKKTPTGRTEAPHVMICPGPSPVSSCEPGGVETPRNQSLSTSTAPFVTSVYGGGRRASS